MDSKYIEGPFDQGKAELERQGYDIITLEENAQLRMKEGADSQVSRSGNWVAEDFIYVPKKGVFLIKDSPLSNHENAIIATQANREGKEYFLTSDQIEHALENSIQVPTDKSYIPTDRFAEDEFTLFAFGESAEQYGQFLKDAGTSSMPIWTISRTDIDKPSRPFAKKVWLHAVGPNVIGAYDTAHLYDGRVRGIKRSNLITNIEAQYNTFHNINGEPITSQEQIENAIRIDKK